MPTPFQEKIYSILRTIPKGKVATYGQLAKLSGSPNAARAIGLCMKMNPDAPTNTLIVSVLDSCLKPLKIR